MFEKDTPLRLAEAAAMAFPNGGITAKSLRLEAQRGRLVIERIAGKDFTTLAAIENMRRLCRVAPKVGVVDDAIVLSSVRLSAAHLTLDSLKKKRQTL